MCLNLRDKFNVPYNNKKIRWKVVRVWEDDGVTKQSFCGPYTHYKYAKPGVWMEAAIDDSYIFTSLTSHNIGFHVFLTKKDATNYASYFSKKTIRIIKVEIDDFNSSGYFYGDKSETWKRMRIL